MADHAFASDLLGLFDRIGPWGGADLLPLKEVLDSVCHTASVTHGRHCKKPGQLAGRFYYNFNESLRVAYTVDERFLCPNDCGLREGDLPENNMFNPPISQDLGDNPGLVLFYTLEDLESWVSAEEAAWSIIDPQQVPEPFRQRAQEQKEAGNSIRTLARRILESGDPIARETARGELDRRLSYYRSHRYTHHSTAWGQSIISAWANNPRVAGAALWAKGALSAEHAGSVTDWVEQGPFRRNMSLVIEALARASVSESATGTPDEDHRNALKAIEQTLVEAAARWREKRQESDAEWGDFKKGASVALSDQVRLFSEERTRAQAAAESLDKETREKIARLEQVFAEKVRLEAPVQYWRNSYKRHDMGVWLFGLVSAAIALVPLLAAAYWVPSIYHEFADFQGKLGTGGIAIVLTFAVLYFLLARLVGRLFASSLAQRDDSGERIVMAETFLALQQDGKMTEKERELALATLFRPRGATGADDAAAGLVDAISKAMSPK